MSDKNDFLSIDPNSIQQSRRLKLEILAQDIRSLIAIHEVANVTVICTHNSRRSQLAQFWINTLASIHGLAIHAWSGGTETTAFNHRMVHAMRSSGFEMTQISQGENPLYISGDEERSHLRYFSKVYYEEPNPKSNYIAILVCSSANETCPVVFGSSKRHFLPFEDPKHFDDTPQEEDAYLSKVEEVGQEMKYMLSLIWTGSG